jgi:ethanolamine ammonia-lyase large subunit
MPLDTASGFSFRDLRELLAKANEPKSGDQLAGIAATSAQERVAAKRALAETTLARFVEEPVIAPERDELTRAFLAEQDVAEFRALAGLSVGELRERLLAGAFAAPAALAALRRALLPEHAAALAKLCSNLDLALAASGVITSSIARATRSTASSRSSAGFTPITASPEP